MMFIDSMNFKAHTKVILLWRTQAVSQTSSHVNHACMHAWIFSIPEHFPPVAFGNLPNAMKGQKLRGRFHLQAIDLTETTWLL